MKKLVIFIVVAGAPLASGLLWAAETKQESEPHSEPLQLTTWVSGNGTLGYRLINYGEGDQVFGVMTCSQMDNWSLDNPAVELVWPGFRGCDKNYCKTIVLQTMRRIDPVYEGLDGTLHFLVKDRERPESNVRLHLKTCSPTTAGKALPIREVSSNKIKLEVLVANQAKSAISDPISRLVLKLDSSHGLWMNGEFPRLSSAPTASLGDMLNEFFKMISFEEGRVKKYEILEVRQVRIKGSMPDEYTVAHVKTDLGEKIVIAQHHDKSGWWVRAYDPER